MPEAEVGLTLSELRDVGIASVDDSDTARDALLQRE